ncbi:hypothetical protein [Solicola gregarius]|uniref:Uncharacterized protein n=1 Tax=Solicola gregarius TaxID=2908642 RepID=A0AA46TKA8_9ACTN|nr:hypothetical protein [Solicola gregarius]UYM06665.1 hypothetical protein L0C25_06235 [Solicola gregarius]
MTKRMPAKRRYLASSPFQPKPAEVIEQYAVGDRVSHDTYGVGRVIDQDGSAVTVNFGSQTVRVASPFHKMERL